MSKRPSWRQLTLFDDHEIAIPVSVESPSPSAPNVDQVGPVPAIDVGQVRRKKPERRAEVEGPRLL